MNLFELDDTYTVNFKPEIFLIEPFKKLKDSRKKDIELLYKEMAFIYFFTDMASDFQYQTDEKERIKEVSRLLKLDSKWQPDKLLLDCIKTYEYLSQTVSSNLLKSVYIAVDKINKHLESIDLDERDKANRPIWNQKSVSDIIKGVPELLKSIRQAESEYIKGKDINDKLRGDKIKTLYEDGIITKSNI